MFPGQERSGDGGWERRLCSVSGAGGEVTYLERENPSAKVTPNLSRPRVQLPSKVRPGTRAVRVQKGTQINGGLNLIFKSNLKCQANF